MRVKLLPLWLALAGLVGCDSDDGATPEPPRPFNLRVTFAEAQTRTALPDGQVAFAVEPTPSALDTIVCTVDGDPLACSVDIASGEARFASLRAPGCIT